MRLDTVTHSDRFTQHRLEAHERPRAIFEFYVTGTGMFPFDMLRYDACWPASSSDASKMEDSTWSAPDRKSGPRSIMMRSYCAPTVDRWSSFTWSVGTQDLTPKAA